MRHSTSRLRKLALTRLSVTPDQPRSFKILLIAMLVLAYFTTSEALEQRAENSALRLQLSTVSSAILRKTCLIPENQPVNLVVIGTSPATAQASLASITKDLEAIKYTRLCKELGDVGLRCQH
jgi:hypothetical protein